MRRLSSDFPRFLLSFVAAGGLTVATGCKCSESADGSARPDDAPADGAPAEAETTEKGAEAAEDQAMAPLGHPVPTGPRLVVAPGKGMSAIRFGTNLETLDRHMGGPCDIVTDTRCIYVTQAVDFSLKDGVVSGMKAHRRDRVVPDVEGSPRYFGTFRGMMFPKIMLGLHRHVVVDEFGEPQKKEPLSGPDGQVERHVYDGVVLEYDKLENGNIVLSAIEVIPSDTAPQGPQKSRSE